MTGGRSAGGVSRIDLVSCTPYVFVAIAWLYFAVLHPIPYWQQTWDYSWYSMSQAFTFESKMAGFPASNSGFNEHPGVPFGFASWVALRIATFGAAGSAERIAYAVDHAEEFWMSAKFIALTLTLAGIFVIHRMFRKNPRRFLIACGLYFAATPTSFGAGFLELTNESFALVFISVFYLMTYKMLLTPAMSEVDQNAVTRVPAQTQGRRDLQSASLGMLAALGCSIKIYYLAPAIGLMAALCAATALGLWHWRVALRALAFFGVGFVSCGCLVVFLVLGVPVFENWLQWNAGMLSHTNRYGTGGSGFLNWSNVLSAAETLARSTQGAFPVIFIGLSAFTIVIWFARRREWAANRGQLPFLVAILTGMSVNLVGLLKHYAPHYALPLCAAFPCLVFMFGYGKIEQAFFRIATYAAPILLAITVVGYSNTNASEVRVAETVVRDATAIERMPIAPGERRVWGYFSPSRGGVLPMIVAYAGSDFVRTAVKDRTNPTDISPLDERDAIHWRYIMLPKTYFPKSSTIATNIGKMFDFKLTNFSLRPSDTITEMETFFVVTRVSENQAIEPR